LKILENVCILQIKIKLININKSGVDFATKVKEIPVVLKEFEQYYCPVKYTHCIHETLA